MACAGEAIRVVSTNPYIQQWLFMAM